MTSSDIYFFRAFFCFKPGQFSLENHPNPLENCSAHEDFRRARSLPFAVRTVWYTYSIFIFAPGQWLARQEQRQRPSSVRCTAAAAAESCDRRSISCYPVDSHTQTTNDQHTKSRLSTHHTAVVNVRTYTAAETVHHHVCSSSAAQQPCRMEQVTGSKPSTKHTCVINIIQYFEVLRSIN